MLEYKESLSSSLARDLTAFANSSGGKVLLGVRNDGTVIGVRDSNKLRAQIQDIARNCDPPVKILIETVGKVTAITVRGSESNPFNAVKDFSGVKGQLPRNSHAMRYEIFSEAKEPSDST